MSTEVMVAICYTAAALSLISMAVSTLAAVTSCKLNREKIDETFEEAIHYCTSCAREWHVKANRKWDGCPVCNKLQEESEPQDYEEEEEEETASDYAYRILDPFDLNDDEKENIVSASVDGLDEENFEKSALSKKVLSLLNYWFNEHKEEDVKKTE